LTEILLGLVAAVLAITLHEAAHGYAAWALGDDTARKAGRLSLSPFAHVDRMGTIIVPITLLVGQLLTIHRVDFMFGWAKPVPVDASRFRAPRQMMAVVALAGPAMNFMLAFLAAQIFRFPDLSIGVAQGVQEFILFNLMLGLFNLFPMPPLDGGRIMVGILPLPLARAWASLERYGIVLVLLLVAAPPLLREQGYNVDPLGYVLTPALNWAYGAVLWLAGVGDGGG